MHTPSRVRKQADMRWKINVTGKITDVENFQNGHGSCFIAKGTMTRNLDERRTTERIVQFGRIGVDQLQRRARVRALVAEFHGNGIRVGVVAGRREPARDARKTYAR